MKIQINFNQQHLCLCRTCIGCISYGRDYTKVHCLRKCGDRPKCLPLVACPGYCSEQDHKEIQLRTHIYGLKSFIKE